MDVGRDAHFFMKSEKTMCIILWKRSIDPLKLWKRGWTACGPTIIVACRRLFGDVNVGHEESVNQYNKSKQHNKRAGSQIQVNPPEAVENV